MDNVTNYNSYGAKGATKPHSDYGINGEENVANASKKDGSQLEMDDFLNLLTTQLSNQDVMNPSSDTEFIAQMAQFTSLQAMQTLAEINYASYGASMIGKKVVVAAVNEKTGKLEKDTGFVSTVTLDGGSVNITVNGKTYPMSGVMEVLDPNAPDKPDEEDPEKPDVEDPEKPNQDLPKA